MKKYLILFLNLIIIPCFSLLFSQEKTLYVTDKNNPNIIHTREYHVHLPANYSDTTVYPLVLAFHGRGGVGNASRSQPSCSVNIGNRDSLDDGTDLDRRHVVSGKTVGYANGCASTDAVHTS